MSWYTRHPVVCLVVVCLQLLTLAGVVFAWAPLRLILLNEGVFSGRCAERDFDGSIVAADGSACSLQEIQFNFVFSLGSWAGLSSRLLLGPVLDQLGTRATNALASMIMAIGSLLFALASSGAGGGHPYLIAFPGIEIGFFLIGFGGPGILMTLQSVCLLFPRHHSMVLGLLSSIFNSSALVFIFFEWLNSAFAVTRTELFFCFAGLCVLWVAFAVLAWPAGKFAPSPEHTSANGVPLSRLRVAPQSDPNCDKSFSSDQNIDHVSVISVPPNVTRSSAPSSFSVSPVTASHHPSALRLAPSGVATFFHQLCSSTYAFGVAFHLIPILALQFYIATVGDQLDRLGDIPEHAYTRAFSYMLSTVGLPVGILVGYGIDRLGFAKAWVWILLLVVTFCGGAAIPSLPFQYVTFIAYAGGRIAVFSSFFAYVSKRFSFQHYGKLIGIGLCVMGCFSLLQYPLALLALVRLNGNYAWIMLALGVLVLPLIPIGVAHEVWVGRKPRA